MQQIVSLGEAMKEAAERKVSVVNNKGPSNLCGHGDSIHTAVDNEARDCH